MPTVRSRRELFFPSAAPASTTPPEATTPSTPAQTQTSADAEPLGIVPVPSAADRHILSRFSNGITPGLVAESAAAGGARAWFNDQLDAGSTAPDTVDTLHDWWPHLNWTPAEKWAADATHEYSGFEQDNDFCRWTLMRRITSKRQLEQVMTEVWGNLLYISLVRKSFPHLPRYDAIIRAHALGTYEELLIAAVLHPGMLLFLDNARSTGNAPNENLGRELLELHTVGRTETYTEEEVWDSTLILTGYRVLIGDSCEPYYAPEDHWVGPVSVMGFQHPNGRENGREVTLAYLRYLANHPATAKHVVRVLATRFVSDTPSDALINALAAVYLSSGTDIPTVLRALIDTEEFAGSAGLKIRTPIEDFVNTYRVMDVEVAPPTADPGGAANAILAGCTSMGQRPFDWPRPDGFPDVGDAWSSASRMLNSWRVHKNLAGGYYPTEGIEYQLEAHWLGKMPVTFADLVDRMSRLLLAKPSNQRLLNTCVTAINVAADEIVTPAHRAVRRMPTLLLALLDTPDHMTR